MMSMMREQLRTCISLNGEEMKIRSRGRQWPWGRTPQGCALEAVRRQREAAAQRGESIKLERNIKVVAMNKSTIESGGRIQKQKPRMRNDIGHYERTFALALVQQQWVRGEWLRRSHVHSSEVEAVGRQLASELRLELRRGHVAALQLLQGAGEVLQLSWRASRYVRPPSALCEERLWGGEGRVR